MKKAIAVILAAVLVASVAMIGCSKKTDDTNTTQAGLADNADNYNLDGEDGEENGDDEANVSEPDTTTTTVAYDGSEGTTSSDIKESKDDKVPSSNDKGDKVRFSAKDNTRLKDMLEVPYLYNASYENSDGVPAEIASHVAIWMAQRDGLNTTTYASGTIVLDLFKYFGQTVVNFKTNCNDNKGNADITYNTANDTFTIPKAEAHQHTVKITTTESLGNNYYRITATVSGAGSISMVVAVVQKNKLDSSLGFSIKALKWS